MDDFRSYFKDQLQRLSPSEKKNFLKAARVIFDNAASVLRAACVAKHKSHDIALPTKNEYENEKNLELEEIEFSTLTKHLKDNEPCKPEALVKCHFMPQPAFMVAPGSAGNEKVVVLIALSDADISSLPALNDRVFIHWGKKNCSPWVTKIDGLHYYLDTGKEIVAEVSVYRPTDIWAAVDDLRIMRNSFVGHPPSTSISDDALEMMLAKVKKAYDKLMHAVRIPQDDHKKLMEEFEKIEKEKLWPVEKVEEELQKFWDDSRFWQNMAEGKMDNLSDEVQILKRDLSTATEKVRNLEQELTTDTLTEELQQMDAKATKEREELMQKHEEATKDRELLRQNYEELRRALEERHCDVVYQNRFEGQGNTYNVHQYYYQSSTTSDTQLSGDLPPNFTPANQDENDGVPNIKATVNDQPKMTIAGTTVTVPRLDPCLRDKLLNSNSMTVPATRIHEFADEIDLVLLAHSDLEKKTQKKQPDLKQPRQSQQLTSAHTTKEEIVEGHWKKTAVGLYKKQHPGNAGMLKKRKKESKQLITGMVEYILYKDGEPLGIMHPESVTLRKFKARPEKTEKVYHRIQALLYAGVYQYCDYVQYSKDKEEICVYIVAPDENWRTTIVPRAQNYCQYYDLLLKKVLEVNNN